MMDNLNIFELSAENVVIAKQRCILSFEVAAELCVLTSDGRALTTDWVPLAQVAIGSVELAQLAIENVCQLHDTWKAYSEGAAGTRWHRMELLSAFLDDLLEMEAEFCQRYNHDDRGQLPLPL